MMKYVGGLVSETQKERLYKIAKREGRTVASIIRYLVNLYIVGNEEPEDKEESV